MDFAIKTLEISNNQFSPAVLRSSYLSTGMEPQERKKFNLRSVYDYELEFYTESDGEMLLDNKNYKLTAGAIAFRRPGEVTQGILPYNCYLVCFDLMGNMDKDPLTYFMGSIQEFQPYYINPILDAIPSVFNPKSTDKYHRLFESIFKEFINHKYGSELLLKSLVLQILFSLYRDVCTTSYQHLSLPSSHKTAIMDACEYMKRHLKENLNLESISSASGLSPFYFHKLFHKAMGMPPGKYLTGLRLKKAKELLVYTTTSINDISYACGYENPSYFCSLFKKSVGVTPMEFRNQHAYI